MTYYLLQNYKDKLTQNFLDGLIDSDIFFEMDMHLDKHKEFYIMNLN